LECIRIFLEHRSEDLGAAVFDKDDDLAVEFVTAAANLRACCFGIPQQNLFEAKVSDEISSSQIQRDINAKPSCAKLA
jgi:Ubiquitin-activating enzyme active site